MRGVRRPSRDIRPEWLGGDRPRWTPTPSSIDFARWKWRQENQIVEQWWVCPLDGCPSVAQRGNAPICQEHDVRMIEVKP